MKLFTISPDIRAAIFGTSIAIAILTFPAAVMAQNSVSGTKSGLTTGSLGSMTNGGINNGGVGSAGASGLNNSGVDSGMTSSTSLPNNTVTGPGSISRGMNSGTGVSTGTGAASSNAQHATTGRSHGGGVRGR